MKALLPLLEYEIFLPTSAKSEVPFPTDYFAKLKQKLTDFFGGVTIGLHRNEGIWRVGSQVVRDEIQMWKVLSTRGVAGDVFISDLKKQIERDLQEEVILVVRRELMQIG